MAFGVGELDCAVADDCVDLVLDVVTSAILADEEVLKVVGDALLRLVSVDEALIVEFDQRKADVESGAGVGAVYVLMVFCSGERPAAPFCTIVL